MRIYNIIISVCLSFSLTTVVFAQRERTDANIFGHLVHDEEHIPHASVVIKGTSLATLTDETGHYYLVNIPEGEHTLVVSALGYESQERTVVAEKGKTIEVDFEMTEGLVSLDKVVVTGDRRVMSRKEASVVVSTITPQVFTASQSLTLGDGLNFSSGLRVENNCQNCGFNQVRVNGMEGPYSQILVNGRPIFSGLAGVYGLELIPTSMIDRVEVIKGGGSAMYGSNAIAGTINMILKEPLSNTYELGFNSALMGVGMEGTGGLAPDQSINFNSSVVSPDGKTGLSFYGFYRDREPFDAMGDGFSELSKMENTSLGARFFHRINFRSKISVDFFNVKEDRSGGNRFDYPLHQRDIAEAVKHNLLMGAVTYDLHLREEDQFSLYASGQQVDRDSYYGAERSLSDYGKTDDFTYNIGTQYVAKLASHHTATIGVENIYSELKDSKLGYPDIENASISADSSIVIDDISNTLVTHQSVSSLGAFGQYEFKWQKATVTLGGRFEQYAIKSLSDLNGVPDKSGSVFSPRFSFLYNITKDLQGRFNYATGYRPPQIFDEDLHLETSGSRRVIFVNDPDLRAERSQSYSLSLDYDKYVGTTAVGIILDGFYTILNNPFANEIGEPDASGEVVYTRINAEGAAIVQGVNMEMNVAPIPNLFMTAGYTLQTALYEEAQEFDEKRFFRTPNDYGFFTMDINESKKMAVSVTGTYTGQMLVPYFGTQLPEDVRDDGELRETNPFFDMGMRLRYNFSINGSTLQVYVGAKNVFNSYQNDFDTGIDRDPGYMYGPTTPRTLYFGVKIGNNVK